MNSKIAVLLPVYFKDDLKFFKKSVKSLLEQTIPNIDIILLIDGKINQYLENYIQELQLRQNIIVQEFKVNRGISYVLNDGINYCLKNGYYYIGRMDADDICFLNRFEKQINFLQANKEIDVVGSWAIEIDENEDFFSLKKMPENHRECYKLFKKRDCLIHPSVCFRVSFFEKAGIYNTNSYFAEDTLLWAQGFKNGCKFANLQEPLLYFRINRDFFYRRRGWKHAISILKVRFNVNRTLNYSMESYCYAIAYSMIKLMPKKLLYYSYKLLRK